MAHDWLRDLYLRWTRKAAGTPRPSRITVESLEDRVTPDVTKGALLGPVMPNGQPRFQPGPHLAASPTEVSALVRSADPVGLIAAAVQNEEGGAPFIDLAKTTVIFADDGTGAGLVSVALAPYADPIDAVKWLETVAGVEWAQPNYRVTTNARDWVPNDPQYNKQYHHPLMDQVRAWDITKGTPNIIVAVTDDGVATKHPDLATNIWSGVGKDFVGNNGKGGPDPNPFGFDSHGTHVAGIIAAATNNGVGVAGVAGGDGTANTGVRIMALRWDSSEPGAASWNAQAVAAAFAYAADNGAKIVNSSYNFDFFTSPSGVVDPVVLAGFNYSYSKGVLHFLSAGNNGQLDPPRRVITQGLFVAATDDKDVKAGYSNYGEYVDISAPGSGILSTTTFNSGQGVNYEFYDGTSMAAPNAAGVAALIWSQNPTWTREQVVATLLATTDSIAAANPGFAGQLGTGRVNSYRALTTTLGAPRFGATPGLPGNGSTVDGVSAFRILAPDRFDPASVTATVFELREAGPDGKFDTGDDALVPLIVNDGQPYRMGTNAFEFKVPALGTGQYRFTAYSGGLRNPFGTPLDGNGDGKGGDAFVRTFGVYTPLAVQVYEDWGRNGTADFNDPGVPGVKVYIDANKNGAYDPGEPTGDTDFAGRLTFPAVQPGTYTVAVVVPGGMDPVSPAGGSQTVTITAGGSANLGFGLIRRNSIYGTVYIDQNKSGGRDPAEAGAAAAGLFLDTDGNGVYDAPTKTKATKASSTGSVPIFDLQTSTSPITVTGLTGTLTRLTVTLNIVHTYTSDLDASLVGPDGTVVPLFSGVGGAGANFAGTVLDDNATKSITLGTAPFTGTFRPIGRLATFADKSANGVWKLVVRDNFFLDEGAITSWSLNLTTTVGDQKTVTNTTGHYRFDATAGTYAVGQIRTRGYVPVNPPTWASVLPVTVATGGAATGNDFGLFADPVAPVVANVTRLDKSPTNADTVRYQVRFSEPVTGVTKDVFGVSVDNSGLTGGSVAAVAGDGSVYTVTVATTGGNGSLQLTFANPAGVLDQADNPLSPPTLTVPAYNIDRSPPGSTITSPAPNAVFTDADWVGAISGVASDTGSGLASVLVSIRQPGTGLYWDGSLFGSPTELFIAAIGRDTWTLPFPAAHLGTVEGPYLVRTVAVDAAGNKQVSDSSRTFGFDLGPPSFTTSPNATALNANPITFTLTFTEPVTALDPGLLTAVGGTITGIAPVGGQVGVFASKYAVTVVPDGDGQVTLNVSPGAGADVATNPSRGGGATVTYDGTRPTIGVTGSTDLAVTSAAWPGTLTGAATDNLSGVATLGVAVLRTSTNTYWDGAGFTAAAPVYLPTGGTPGAWSFPFPVGNFPADDNYLFLVRGEDAAGNVTTTPVTVALDNVAPAPSVATPGANVRINAVTFDNTGRLTGTAADAVSGAADTTVAVLRVDTGKYWDGAGFTAAAPVYLATTGPAADWGYIGIPAAALVDGQYTVLVRTADRAGNVGTTSRSFVFDNTAPVPVVDFPDNGTGYNPARWAASGQLTGRALDAGDTVSTMVAVRRLSDGLYWNGSFFGSNTEVLHATTGTPSNWKYAFSSFFFPDEGRYDVRAVSTDSAGNVQGTVTQFSFDRTAPTSAINLPGSGTLFNLASWPNAIPGSATDKLSGVAAVKVSVRQVDGGRYWDGSAFTSATEILFDAQPVLPAGGAPNPDGPLGSWTLPFGVANFKADGQYVVNSYATDGAGNAQTFASSAIIRIDRTVPTGQVMPAGPAVTKAAEIPFDFNFDEPVAGLPAGALQLTNATLVRVSQTTPTSYRVVLRPTADGPVSVGLAARGTTDLAGNPIGAITPASVLSVTTPPRVTIAPPAAPPVAGGTSTFRIAFTQEVTGFEAADLSLTNATLTGLTLVSAGAAGSVFDAAVSPLAAGPVSVTLNPGTVFNRVGLTNESAATVNTTAVEQRFAVAVGPVARLYNRTQGIDMQVLPFGEGYTGEVRTATADFTGDGVPDLVAGTGPGSAPRVVIIDGATNQTLLQLTPFEESFTGGVFVAVGDINGDGAPELVITPDEGGGPRVQVRDGKSFGVIADFFGIDDPDFRGGARAAVGDVTGNGFGDLIVAAGFGGGPRVAVFDGKSVLTGGLVRVVGDFFAYEQSLRNGVYVSAGDLDGDGFAEVVIGGGPGGGPRVTTLNGRDLAAGVVRKTADFFAGDTANRGGVRVAIKDLSADAGSSLIVGSGAGGGTRVTTYQGRSITSGVPLTELDFDLATGTASGVYVG